MPENTHALAFWEKVIVGPYTREERIIEEPEPHKMIVFRFET